MSIIFADDEPFIRNVAGMVLKQITSDVVVCENGEEAIEAYNDNSDGVKLIILDLNMPVKDGLEACKALREAGCTATILALSGGN